MYMKNFHKFLLGLFIVLSLTTDVFIIIESAMEGNASGIQSSGVTQFLVNIILSINPNSHINDDPELLHSIIRKLVGHFLLFGVSGFLTTIPFFFSNSFIEKKVDIIVITLLKGFTLASITELIQHFIPNRYGSFTDILIDFSGFLLFSFLTYILIYINKKKKTSNYEMYP